VNLPGGSRGSLFDQLEDMNSSEMTIQSIKINDSNTDKSELKIGKLVILFSNYTSSLEVQIMIIAYCFQLV